jgi:thioredoxin reductase (NADPH)
MVWDVIIIGGGPAGLAAGLYASRAKLKTLMLEKLLIGGQAATTWEVENYPGFADKVNGPDLTKSMEEQAKRFGLEIKHEETLEVSVDGGIKTVKTDSSTYNCKTIILACGAEPRKTGVKGEDELRGKGVSYCATCDGAFFEDAVVMVVGGGDTAIGEALFLTRFASKVIVVHRRDELRATQVLRDRALNHEKLEFMWDSVIKEIKGDAFVEKVVVENVKTKATSEVAVEGVFVAIGQVPSTGFLKGIVDMDERGYVITNDKMETNVQGVFAAGDMRQKPLRQIVTAVSDGAVAAVSAEHYIESLKS